MAKKNQLGKDDLESQAIHIVKQERDTWEDAEAFVTERVSFAMRNLIRTLRKNYWSIFDTPVDPVTKRKKIFIPLTETMVEQVVKNIDLDTKDIGFRAKELGAVGLTDIVRSIAKNNLDEIYFGEYLDEMERDLAIDGTAVWKTIEEKDVETGKPRVGIRKVDLLNVFIDPTARSIQDAYRFTERSLMTEDEVKSRDWMNTENIEGTVGLAPSDATYMQRANTSTTKLVDVWELWGKIPLSLVTGKKSDEEEEVDGRIIVSGLDSPGKELVHLVEQNKKGIKPYEEAWFTRISGRWYGKGVAEKLLMLQLWLNTIVNIRINRSYVSQLGLFKIKESAGVTPQMLSRLATNGAISVKSMDDIEQMVVQEASQASYNDENVINGWAEKLTSAFEVVTGESLPASTPATNAVIQSRNAQSAFILVKEGVGMFLQRWLKRHALPIIAKQVNKEDVVRVTGDPQALETIDNRIANALLYREIEQGRKAGMSYTPEKVQEERERILERLRQSGDDRYVSIKNKIDWSRFDVQVVITNEEIDKAVVAQNLLALLQTIPAIPGAGIDPNGIVASLMDIMGLPAHQLKRTGQPQMQAPQAIPQQAQIEPGINPQEIVTNANINAA